MATAATVPSSSVQCSAETPYFFVGRGVRPQVSFINYNHAGPRSRTAARRGAIQAVQQTPETQSKSLNFEDGGQWLSSATRHIRIYAGYIDPVSLKMDQTQLDKLSLILDPDDEFVWPGETPQKVFDKFLELVENYAGAPLTEYTLRLIGSDLEHFIRKMLFANEIKYNLECRVLNFSMGKPRLVIEDDEELEATS